jgi:serine protease Do
MSDEMNKDNMDINNNLDNQEKVYPDNDRNIDNVEKINTTEENNQAKDENTVTYSFWAEQIAASYSQDNKNGTQEQMEDNSYNKEESSENYKYNSDTNARYVENKISNNEKDIWSIPDRKNLEEKVMKEKKQRKFFGKAVRTALWAGLFGIIAGASFIGFNGVYSYFNPGAAQLSVQLGGGKNNKLHLIGPKDPDKKLSTTTVSNDTIRPKTDVTDVIENTMPSIVTINSTFTQNFNWFGKENSEDYEGGGSGIIVGQNDTELLIATNNHVVDGAKTIQVAFIDDTIATAVVKGTDAIADLAVLSIDLSQISKETRSAIKVATLGDSENVKVGEMAIAIGNALGYGQSTTVGYIGAKDREVAIEDKKMVLLQTDAAINPGNSGGALLNVKGEVIGINTVKYASSDVEGMGFAIPISRAIPIINELMSREILKDEEKGYLGVYIDDITEESAGMYNWPIGVYIKSFAEGSAAEKAGLLPGDIVVGVNDTEITNSIQLREKVNSYRYGTDITLKVMRRVDGEFAQKEIIVTLGKASTIVN